MRASASILALLLAIASGCSSSVTAKGGDAAVTTDVGQSNDVAQTNDVGQTNDATADAVVPPANVMFPAGPDVSCGGDAGDCPLPPSACAVPCDPTSCDGLQWVVYYDDPVCVSGKCVYTNRYFECSPGTMCTAGGCRFNGTTAAP